MFFRSRFDFLHHLSERIIAVSESSDRLSIQDRLDLAERQILPEAVAAN